MERNGVPAAEATELRALAGERCGADTAGELLDLMRRHGGHSKGYRFQREDAYEGRL